MNAAPLFLGFAGKALLYLQKQQRILQAPAADLALISIICESLAAALKLPSSTPDIANNTKQQVHDAAPGEHHRLKRRCQALRKLHMPLWLLQVQTNRQSASNVTTQLMVCAGNPSPLTGLLNMAYPDRPPWTAAGCCTALYCPLLRSSSTRHLPGQPHKS